MKPSRTSLNDTKMKGCWIQSKFGRHKSAERMEKAEEEVGIADDVKVSQAVLLRTRDLHGDTSASAVGRS